MDVFKKKLIHLLHAIPFSWKQVFDVLQKDPHLASLYSPTGTLQPNLQQKLASVNIDQLLQSYSLQQIKIISIYDEEYPLFLKNTFQPPWLLYAKGEISLLHRDFLLAVVGSREATSYGKKATDHLIPGLIDSEAVIVSGLAKGIDTYAHLAAIRGGGRTIGVIAGGFSHLYPRENIPLAHYMMEKELVISEYPPETRPERWQFPLRNRIIAGISRGTLVIEARKRSGSFITADTSLNEGREVFAVPGNIFAESSAGTNQLLKMGAKLVNVPEDIMEEMRWGVKRGSS